MCVYSSEINAIIIPLLKRGSWRKNWPMLLRRLMEARRQMLLLLLLLLLLTRRSHRSWNPILRWAAAKQGHQNETTKTESTNIS
jgi:hypothetical protein